MYLPSDDSNAGTWKNKLNLKNKYSWLINERNKPDHLNVPFKIAGYSN